MIFDSIRDLEARLAGFVGDVDPGSAKGRKRARILAAATGLFVAQGYRKTNIDEIARAAGIAKGTVYLYFATKAEVLIAAVARAKLGGLALLSDVYEPGISARERLRRWLRASLLTVAGSPLLSRIAAGPQEFAAALADIDPGLRDASFAEYHEFLGGLLDAAVHPRVLAAPERRERIVALDSLRFFAPLLGGEQVRQGLAVERLADLLATMIVDGVHSPGPAAAS